MLGEADLLDGSEDVGSHEGCTEGMLVGDEIVEGKRVGRGLVCLLGITVGVLFAASGCSAGKAVETGTSDGSEDGCGNGFEDRDVVGWGEGSCEGRDEG